MGVPLYRWVVYNGKSHLEMDDNWGYPHFSMPPYVTFNPRVFHFELGHAWGGLRAVALRH